MSERQEKLHDALLKVAGEYISRESNRTTLITATNATISPDFKNATIFVSVFPVEQEVAALDFLKRRQQDFRSFMKSRLSLRTLPYIQFALDQGEKNRQRIDAMLQQ